MPNQQSRTCLSWLVMSRVKYKLVSYFAQNTRGKIYLRELCREVNEDVGNVSRYMSDMQKMGIVTRHCEEGRAYYQANKLCPVLADLKRIGEYRPASNGVDDGARTRNLLVNNQLL